MGVRIDDIKLIPKEEVPKKRSRRTRWDVIFRAIPNGQAAVLTESNISLSAVRQALKRRKRKGLYQHLSIITEGKKGQQTIYIVNNKEK